MSNRKYFPKFIYFFLVALFTYNSIGYLFFYFPVKAIIRQIVQESIKEKKIDQAELSILVFNISALAQNKYDFIWKKPGKEFRFNGKMYDIEDKVVSNDTVYYTVYYDHKENIIEEIFTLHFNDNRKDKTQNSFLRIVLMGIFSEESIKINTTPDHLTASNIPLQKNKVGFLNNVADVPTHPPRNIV